MTKIKVLLVDDHLVIRKGLRLLLEDSGEIQVLAEASSGDEAIELLKEISPDVVLMDLSLPGIDGVTAIGMIKATNPKQRILTLTMHEDPVFLEKVLTAGGDGFVLKRAADSELLNAIRAVFRGEVYVDIGLQRYLIKRAMGADSYSQNQKDINTLTRREKEVLKLIAIGYSNKEIANEFCISTKTVENHKTGIKEKLGTSSRSKLVRYAKQQGLI